MSNWKITEAKIVDEGRSLSVSFETGNHNKETNTIQMTADHWRGLWLLESELRKAREINTHLAELNKELMDDYKQQLINCSCLGKKEE